MSFLGPVSDVAWNNNYHMIAVGGFGDEYPILIFVSKKSSENEVDKVLEKLKGLEDEKSNIVQAVAEEQKIKPRTLVK